MKIAVTGATGHLGGIIIRELNQQGYAIRALVRGTPPDQYDGILIDWVQGDLHDIEALEKLTEDCFGLIHSAGLISIHGDQGGQVRRTNVEGTRHVMEAAQHSGVKRVIHVSSIQAYKQLPVDKLLDEQREKTSDRAFHYDRSKRDGEAIALSFADDKMDVLVVNPTSIIAPYDFKPSKMGEAILRMCSGQLPFVLNGGIDCCDGRDVAHAIVNGLKVGRSGESYLLGGQWISLSALAQYVSHTTGIKINPKPLPTILARIGLPFVLLMGWLKKEEPLYTTEAIDTVAKSNRHISSAKAILELNYSPRPFEQTIHDVCRWFTENGYLA